MILLTVFFTIVSIALGQPVIQELPLIGISPSFLDLTTIREPVLPIVREFVPPVEIAEAEPEPAAVTAPVIPAVSSPVVPVLEGADIKTQYYIRDLLGQASYGHVEPGQRHHAFQDAHGNKIGGFSYFDAEGKLVQTGYIADKYGYRVVSNNLPVAPLPVEDTPEVIAAKAQHLLEVEKIDPSFLSLKKI